MLDVITDFWKPVKKSAEARVNVELLSLGAHITFGAVPQPQLAGRRLRVGSVNTYLFGEERLTSFVLAHDGESSISLIVSSNNGEQFLTLSRRIPFTDRMRMLDPSELEAVIEQPGTTRLSSHNVENGWKQWVVGAYKKELSGIKGAMLKGDYRGLVLPAGLVPQPFDYVVLTSDNNEYALEIEKYADGRVEVYAMVYRRLSDVTSIEPAPDMQPPVPLRAPASPPALELVRTEPALVSEPELEPEMEAAEAIAAPAERAVETLELHDDVAEGPEETEDTMAAIAEVMESAPEDVLEAPHVPEAAFTPESESKSEPALFHIEPKEEPTMTTATTTKPAAFSPASPRQEGYATLNRAPLDLENDSVECDLKVANKVIEEAIRNEMRLTDVVRRIIALPLANPESVQIPVVLADEDYQLLAIRYGLPASERAAIKARIVEELSDFSGNR